MKPGSMSEVSVKRCVSGFASHALTILLFLFFHFHYSNSSLRRRIINRRRSWTEEARLWVERKASNVGFHVQICVYVLFPV